MEKECKVCKKIFFSPYKDSVTCSRKCRDELKTNRLKYTGKKLICSHCAKVFYIQKSRHAIYCNKECWMLSGLYKTKPNKRVNPINKDNKNCSKCDQKATTYFKMKPYCRDHYLLIKLQGGK